MKIIISPAKNMQIIDNIIPCKNQPPLLEKTKKLYKMIKPLSYEQLKNVLQANHKIVFWHYYNYQNFDFNHHLTPAILCYKGIQYTHIHPLVFTDSQIEYAKKHLFILSAFYGVVNAYEGIKPYRLEMINPFHTESFNNLYEYWKDDFYQELYKDTDVVINLCSEEYIKTIKPYVQKKQKFITISFYEKRKGKLRQITTHLKIARGTMVNYLTSIQAQSVEEIKLFSLLGYEYQESLSSEVNLVFVKK